MALVELDSDDNKKIFEIDGDTICIEINVDDRDIIVYEAVWDDDEEEYVKSKSIGRIELTEWDSGDHYIQWMFLNGCGGKYLRKGIGRAALIFFKEYFGTKIFAAENDGQDRDDGSHLTMDAPSFIGKMRDEGIVEALEE